MASKRWRAETPAAFQFNRQEISPNTPALFAFHFVSALFFFYIIHPDSKIPRKFANDNRILRNVLFTWNVWLSFDCAAHASSGQLSEFWCVLKTEEKKGRKNARFFFSNNAQRWRSFLWPWRALMLLASDNEFFVIINSLSFYLRVSAWFFREILRFIVDFQLFRYTSKNTLHLS